MLYSSSFDPFRDPRMFGPLLFTVCFGSDSYFRSLELSLKSIATYGAFDGPYLILTDRDGLAPARSAARALPAARVIDIDRPNPATRFSDRPYDRYMRQADALSGCRYRRDRAAGADP